MFSLGDNGTVCTVQQGSSQRQLQRAVFSQR